MPAEPDDPKTPNLAVGYPGGAAGDPPVPPPSAPFGAPEPLLGGRPAFGLDPGMAGAAGVPEGPLSRASFGSASRAAAAVRPPVGPAAERPLDRAGFDVDPPTFAAAAPAPTSAPGGPVSAPPVGPFPGATSIPGSIDGVGTAAGPYPPSIPPGSFPPAPPDGGLAARPSWASSVAATNAAAAVAGVPTAREDVVSGVPGLVRGPTPGSTVGSSRTDDLPGYGARPHGSFGPSPSERSEPPQGTTAPTRRLPDGERRRIAVLAALVGALVGTLAGATVVVVLADRATPSTTIVNAATTPSTVSIHDLIEAAQPSVVAIHTDEERTTSELVSAGTGVVISADGLVLTNNHVVSTVSKLRVVLADGTEHDAEFVGSSPDDDIALVRVQTTEPLQPARLGSSADVRVGDEVVAIGNALDLGGSASVTRGIVSAKDRSIKSGGLFLNNLVQTDAAINPGNSGGPLLNSRGEVVGINTAIVTEAQNVGFAISIDVVKPLIDALREGKGKVTLDTAYLGVITTSLRDVTAEVRDEYAITAKSGAFVQEITANSAAQGADLHLGDVIVAIGEIPVTSSAELVGAVREHAAGDKVTLIVERRGETHEVEVTLGSRRSVGS